MAVDKSLLIEECKSCPYKDLYYCSDCTYSNNENSYRGLVLK